MILYHANYVTKCEPCSFQSLKDIYAMIVRVLKEDVIAHSIKAVEKLLISTTTEQATLHRRRFTSF